MRWCRSLWARSPRPTPWARLCSARPHPRPFPPASVGKTSLLHQYVHKRFYEDYRTTLGASILTKVLAVDNTPLKLQVSWAGTARAAHSNPTGTWVPLCPAVPKCHEVEGRGMTFSIHELC